MRRKHVVVGYVSQDWFQMLEAQKDMGGKEGFALPDIAPSKYFLTDKKVVVIIEEIPEK